MTEQAKTQLRRRRKLLAEKRRKIRLLLLALVLILGSGAFLFHKDKFYALAEVFNWLKQNTPVELLASTTSSSIRGDIFDRNFRPLAATYKTYAIYARPLEIVNPASSATILAEILDLEESKLLSTLKSERGFMWVAQGIDKHTADTIEQRNIKGVYQVVETKRFYPNSKKAAHVVGFVENDQGLDGVEFQYNTILRRDEISDAELKMLNFAPGTEFGESSTHLVLNLDLMLQSKIEHFLERRIKITRASSGSAILINANTGAILALASFPSFNPNRYWEFSSSALRNHALTEPVYPGELALIFQQAAAFNLENIQSESAKNPDEINSVTVITPDKQKRRKMSVAPQVDYVEPHQLAQFAQLLGFDQKPLTDLPLKDESPASSSLVLNSPSFNSSALRLLTGFTTLVNGGRLITPHLLHKAYQKNKATPFETALNAPEQNIVLHPKTTKDLTDFLASKWLNLGRKNRRSDSPMFFEAHRFINPAANSAFQKSAGGEDGLSAQAPYLAQSVMLGAIPGKDPKLTMVAFLSYPDSCDEIYPAALETFGNDFSILSPDKDMVQKMLHVAAMPSPNPSPDFWDSETAMFVAQDPDSLSHGGNASTAQSSNSKKSMPDVTGKSLRAGLQVLQHLNLDIKLVGSGRIVSQRPVAGTELINENQCILEMQQEI